MKKYPIHYSFSVVHQRSFRAPVCLRKGVLLSILIFGVVCSCQKEKGDSFALPIYDGTAHTYLKTVMDKFHKTLDVYTEPGAGGNHFVEKAAMNGAVDMEEAHAANPHSGYYCIKATYKKGNGWNGWYFMNGVFESNAIAPMANWGTYPNAGYNVGNPDELTFYARGENGGEKVEFFCAGVGRNADSGAPEKAFPDSSPKITTGFVTLTKEWKKYSINTKGKDLSYVLGGFGWVSKDATSGNKDLLFYLDDIQYQISSLAEPRMLTSFEVENSDPAFDNIMRNVSFLYDDALALMAFLSEKDYDRAKILADALVYVVYNDRFFPPGHVRNGYQSGSIAAPPGWTPNGRKNTARLPGWYDGPQKKWLEDEFNVSIHTGNAAWLMLSLLSYHQTVVKSGSGKYLDAAKLVGEWVHDNCYDTRGAGGYTGGFQGWEPNQEKLLYKATEHQIDLYSAFQRLFLITHETKWKERADHAKACLLAMYDPNEGKFFTGTGTDGVTINPEVIPVDIQAWAILSLKDEITAFLPGLQYAENHIKVGGGYAFSQKDLSAAWMEGTGQMAAVYYFLGENSKANDIIRFIQSNQDASGGIYATSAGIVKSGFDWSYFHRKHVGATAWYILAKNRENPFWLGAD